jgi:glutamate-1-semialdehyde 2,1-aminomutase
MTFFANNAAASNWPRRSSRRACCEQVRFVTSGGEADMYAIRLARAFTGAEDPEIRGRLSRHERRGADEPRAERQVNFPTPCPTAPASPPGVAAEMLIAPFNDLQTYIRLALAEHGDIAAIIVEPLQRIIPPSRAFWRACASSATATGMLLIFDEIVTGFRLAYGGAQERYGVTPTSARWARSSAAAFRWPPWRVGAEIMAHFDKAAWGRKNG